MDLIVLQRLAQELDERLRGQRIEQVWALPKTDVVLAIGRRSAPRLWFCGEPDQPHLYLRQGTHDSPQRPPGFAMAARNLLAGRRIEAIRGVPGDRIVELLCAGEGAPRVIFELIPRRATTLLVDGDGTIAAAWLPRRGRPGLGERYQPPADDTRTPLDEVPAQAWDDLAALPDDDALVRGLLRAIRGMSPLVAREIAWRYSQGTPLPRAAAQEIERAEQEPTAAAVWAPREVEQLATLPPQRRFLLAPYPLSHLEDEKLIATAFASLLDAAATYYPLRAGLGALQTAREQLVSALELGHARVQRTLDAVANDAADTGDAEQQRQWADLLLAYPRAERQGDVVRVPDPWADDDAEVAIPVDPSRSNVDNAQSLYARARRAERAVERTAARRRRLEARAKTLAGMIDEARDAASLGECVHLARAARPHGVRVATAKWRRTEDSATGPAPQDPGGPAPAQRGPGGSERLTAGVDRYTASDGAEILVGRSAKGNERVSHKLAAPHDFWLHAEGPGSHVLIRNPQRNDTPGDDALREAAALAAWFSRARGATKVNVRWTQARHVRKPRGAPTGQVTLRQSETVLAEPVAPEELFAPEQDSK